MVGTCRLTVAQDTIESQHRATPSIVVGSVDKTTSLNTPQVLTPDSTDNSEKFHDLEEICYGSVMIINRTDSYRARH